MNNKSKIAISVAAALCTATLAASTIAQTSSQTTKQIPDFLKEVKITPEMVESSKAREKKRNRFTGEVEISSPAANVNIHRALPSKVPFTWDPAIQGEHTFIVEFMDQPISTYDGRVPGLKATNLRSMPKVPVTLANPNAYKINTSDPQVIEYNNYLAQKQHTQLAQISQVIGQTVKPKHTYKFALNGASMVMTQAQAQRVAALDGVRSVKASKNYQLMTDVGPKHIKADKVWPLANNKTLSTKGEGVIMGIIDTGVNTDHPSFASVAGDGYVHTNPRGRVYGDCEVEEFASLCNDKLIGVRSYDVITDTYWSSAYQPEYEWYETPEHPVRPENGEDYQGHGSHTASTAAGNELFNVPYHISEFAETSDGIPTDLIFGHISGVAPRANIISYQTCFANDGSFGTESSPTAQWQGCPAEALIAALEDAIQDGVDVINFSIGGGESSPWEDPVEMAFLSAREAGISAALAAGNSGWEVIDHVSPWVTTVAATTHGREIAYSEKRLEAMSGGDTTPPTDIVGKGFTEAFTGNLVLASMFGDENCNSPFPEGTFTDDQIVVCKRGTIARVEKAVNVKAGGAGAMVLYNGDYTEDSVMPTDPYVIPSILIDSNAGYSLVNWLASGNGHMATISASSMDVSEGTADFVADFSSRGPSRTTPGSMVPNVGAPGVNVFAAFADDKPFTTSPFTSDYSLLSGTSMAAPHVAGSMALLTQLHPDWTPAEIQSALMTTAHGGTSTINYWGETGPAGIDDFGSGIIDVEKAAKVGLVMDETAENYRAANPNNGGDISALNDAYLFNMNCEFNCTWVRTFRATEDGTWSIDMMENDANGLELLDLKAHPAHFTLKKGEVRSVMFTASVKDISNPINSTKDALFEGMVTITPDNSEMPIQKLPMRLQFGGDGLPNNLNTVMHRQTGSVVTPALYTKEVGDIRINGLTKGEARYHSLVPHTDNGILDPIAVENSEGIEVIPFTVPEGTKRVIFEISEVVDRTIFTEVAMDIGKDINGDGKVQWLDEAICYSFTYDYNYCAIDNPEPGQYWAMVGNYTLYDPNNPRGLDKPVEMVTNLAIIPEENNQSVNVNIEGEANGIDGYRLNMNWQLDDAKEHDVYFATLEMGRDASNPGDVGVMGLRFERQGADFNVSASQDKVKTGDVVDFYIEAQPNMTLSDRNFTLTATLPSGMNLSKESIDVEGMYAEMTKIDGNTITISGIQPSEALTPRQYIWSTSEDNAMCRMPYDDGDSKKNWFDLSYYFYNPTAIEGNVWNDFYVEYWQLGLEGMSFYGNEYNDVFTINPAGFVSPSGSFYQNYTHTPMEFLQFPTTMVAPLWNAAASITPGIDFMTGKVNGLFVANTINNELIVQWNGAYAFDFWTWTSGSYSTQMIMKSQPDFDEGQHEILFGYDRIDESLQGNGTIGTRGYHGFLNPFGPNEGYIAQTLAYNNVDDTVAPNVLVCGDYSGPERSTIKLNFKALVNNSASGQDQTISVSSAYDNSETVTETLVLAGNGNIKIGQFNDATIDENTALEGLEVIFSATNSTEKVISVTGEHVTANIDGNTSGALVDIIPEQNWYGDTLVTVSVADATNSNDVASASFMLTVTSDGLNNIQLKPMQNMTMTDNMSFDINVEYTDMQNDANIITVAGDHISARIDNHESGAKVTITPEQGWAGETEITIMVSDSANPEDFATTSFMLNIAEPAKSKPELEPETKKNSSGSLAWLLLGLPFVFRRKK